MAELGIGQAVLEKSKKQKQDEHLKDFATLARNSMIWVPPQTAASTTSTSVAKGAARRPPLVVLCSWMGAAPKHIAKYTDAYRRRFPDAGILLITSETADMLTRGDENQQRVLTPVRNVLRSAMNLHGEEAAASPTILHVFSLGGCNSATELVRSFQHFKTAPPLAFDAFILDSCPGSPSLTQSVRAVTTVLPPNPLTRLPLLALTWIFIAIYRLLVHVGLVRGTEHLRKDLIDPILFPLSTPRLYLYSRADQMSDFAGVRRHAEEAEAAGYKVESVVFEGSPHCGHVIEDEERYWDAVKKVWPKTD